MATTNESNPIFLSSKELNAFLPNIGSPAKATAAFEYNTDKRVLIKIDNEPKPADPLPEITSFAIRHLPSGLVVDGHKIIPFVDVFKILESYGLKSHLPKFVDLGSVPGCADWKICKETPWNFDWPNGTTTIPCSITCDTENIIRFRVHDLRPAIVDQVLTGFTEHLRSAWKESTTELSVYTVTRGTWTGGITRPHRPLDTIYVDSALKAKLVREIETFLASSELYDSYGIAWKRVHLFHGVPGTGKTSMVHALASHFKMHLSKMNAGRLASDAIEALVRNLPKKSWLLIEDITELFSDRDAKTGLDFSTLLNLLDGMSTPRGLVVFITTNHVEQMDPAMIRPGRVDSNVAFEQPSRATKLMALQRMGPKYALEHETYLDHNPNITIAEIQRHLFECAVENRDSMLAPQ